VVRPSLTLAAVAENAGVNMAEYSDVLNRPVRLPVAMLVLCCQTPRNRDVRYTPASDRMAE
jgi:hypothetical protein